MRYTLQSGGRVISSRAGERNIAGIVEMCLYNALKLQQEAISKRNSVSFPELLGVGNLWNPRSCCCGLLLYCILIRMQHVYCQGTRFSLLRLSQTKALHYFFKIAKLRYIKIFKASFFSNSVSCETAIYFNLCDLWLVT